MEENILNISVFDFDPTPKELDNLLLSDKSKGEYIKSSTPRSRLIDISILFLLRDDIIKSIEYYDLSVKK